MKFTMSNGTAATWAATWEAAEELLGTSEINQISVSDLSAKDWQAVDQAHPLALWPEDFEGLRVYALAC